VVSVFWLRAVPHSSATVPPQCHRTTKSIEKTRQSWDAGLYNQAAPLVSFKPSADIVGANVVGRDTYSETKTDAL